LVVGIVVGAVAWLLAIRPQKVILAPLVGAALG
jgi:hypothetical protein